MEGEEESGGDSEEAEMRGRDGEREGGRGGDGGKWEKEREERELCKLGVTFQVPCC